MEFVLESRELRVKVNTLGAELTGITSKSDGTEYLWGGDPMFWGRHSPVLFPIVGALKNNALKYNNHEYLLSQHGFARDMEFQLVHKDDSNLLFELESDSETLSKYPFEFILRIGYELQNKTLKVSYNVLNPTNDTILFSIGAHPAFNCPLNEKLNFEDYFLEFEKDENCDRFFVKNGLQSSDVEENYMSNSNLIKLSEGLFQNDALIFKGLKSDSICLCSHKDDKYVKVSFAGFPYMGIWKKNEAPFICIEPWFGIADKFDFTGDIENKEGIVHLGGGDKFLSEYFIECG